MVTTFLAERNAALASFLLPNTVVSTVSPSPSLPLIAPSSCASSATPSASTLHGVLMVMGHCDKQQHEKVDILPEIELVATIWQMLSTLQLSRGKTAEIRRICKLAKCVHAVSVGRDPTRKLQSNGCTFQLIGWRQGWEKTVFFCFFLQQQQKKKNLFPPTTTKKKTFFC